MKKKIKSFGCVFPITSGKNAGKFFYAFKDKDGLNQHSEIFDDVEDCSQVFAQAFAQYIIDGMMASIDNPQEQ